MEKADHIILTKDGSHSVRSEKFGAEYHSIHGAIQESKHVFIEAGLNHLLETRQIKDISILEMGLGTGLNAFLTLLEADTVTINYTALELYPIDQSLINKLNYLELLEAENHKTEFEQLHTLPFHQKSSFTNNFHFLKLKQDLLSFETETKFDLIYFDAFAPGDQPELWTETIFSKLYSFTQDNGVLVTYCAKGDARRALQASGWIVEKIPGPPGKREMLRAIKRSPTS